MGDEETTTNSPLIPTNTNTRKSYHRVLSHANDELHSFRSYLRYMCVDQSNIYTSSLSYLCFIIFTIVIPSFSHFYLSCPSCDAHHDRPYDVVVQLSLSAVATLAFVSLTYVVKKFGLRKFLFFDKLVGESDSVRHHYTTQLNRSLKIVSAFVGPCFIAEAAYKIWWYASGGSRIPFLGNIVLSDIVACSLELLSWLYRILVFFLVCVLLRLICYLQILRLKDFASVFTVDTEVADILKEHLRIRRHLRIISHRCRAFILGSLVLVTVSLLASLLVTTKSHDKMSVFRSGELALSSMTVVTGLMIILRSATKITHKAQAITCLASKWHVSATIDSFNNSDTETPAGNNNGNGGAFSDSGNGTSDWDDAGSEEDDVDNTRFLPAYTYSTISFQKRQALVTYLENNKAGITVYGFMLDRAWLQLIFGIEMSLVLWLLGKTIVNL